MGFNLFYNSDCLNNETTEKLGNMHRKFCEVSAQLENTCPGAPTTLAVAPPKFAAAPFTNCKTNQIL